MQQLPIIQAELRERILFRERNIKIWQSGKARPPHMEVTARTDSGGCHFDIAVCQLLLGQVAAAQTSFTQATILYEEATCLKPKLVTFEVAMEAALLSGNREMAQRIARHPLEREQEPSLLRDRLFYALALPALTLGKDEMAGPHIKAALAIDHKKACYPGVGEALRAVSESDASRFQSALETMLKKHHAYARATASPFHNAPSGFICLPGTTLSIVASWRGIQVPEDLPGRHAILKLRLIHLKEFEGRPIERGTTADLAVDYIPAPLVN